jgi:hypothetical protein
MAEPVASTEAFVMHCARAAMAQGLAHVEEQVASGVRVWAEALNGHLGRLA